MKNQQIYYWNISKQNNFHKILFIIKKKNRYFVNQLQTTPKEYLQIQKVREAMPLILKDIALIEIAYSLNFTDQSHFIKTFKKYTNRTPSQFKQTSSQVDNMLIWNLE